MDAPAVVVDTAMVAVRDTARLVVVQAAAEDVQVLVMVAVRQIVLSDVRGILDES